MADSELDNPFWSSLHTRHRQLALGDDKVTRYPHDYAPFLCISS